MIKYRAVRRFWLDRKVDVTGVSGTGTVAEGCVFGDGTTVVRWLGDHPTTTVHPSVESVEHIHLHEGRTEFRWQDPICFVCGTENSETNGMHCYECGASTDEPFMETRPNPSLGKWTKALTVESPPKAEET